MCISFLQRMGLFLGFSRAPTPPFSPRIAGHIGLQSRSLQRLALNQARSMAPGLNERLRARITIGLSPQLLPARSRNELRFFTDGAAKKWPLRGSLKLG